MEQIRLQRRDVQFAGQSLAAWDAGPLDAPALVVCHGGCLDHSAFRGLAERHSGEMRVVLWDLPGHGQSPRIPAPFSAALCARAMAAVMDQLRVRDATVLGFSFGGVTAQLAAKARPDLVRRLIAYGCLSPLVGKPLAPPGLAPFLINALFGLRSGPAIETWFAKMCCLSQAGQDRVRQEMAPVGKAGFLAMAAANLAASDRDGDFRIRGGVELIAGAKDRNGGAIWRTFRALQAAYPQARTVLIPDAGHCAHLDQPDAFAAAIDHLIRSDPSSSN